ncbi:hypothetical protein ACFL27_25820 [candidate division CSSED10-310 bacterium]|uniref:Tetratricopeptide repeat protein n=1 Tax=candidate division CSSED10-310 bacterium TaxID=2855610 RepID=A0ABV6Z595_UNCC1
MTELLEGGHSELERLQLDQDRMKLFRNYRKNSGRFCLSGLGLAFFLHMQASDFATLTDALYSSERIWLLPSHGLFFILVGGCISGVAGVSFLLALLVKRAAACDYEKSLTLCSQAFLPFSLGCVNLLQFNTFLASITHFSYVITIDLAASIFIFSTVAVVISYATLLWPALGSTIRNISQCFNWSNKFQRRILLGFLFIISFTLYSLVGRYLPGLNGDEPHYLLIMQSILNDHDLDINNNYINKDYNAYIAGVLDRHVTIGRDETRYSTHPVGLAFLLAPAYYCGGYGGVVRLLNVLAAILSVQLFLLGMVIIRRLGWSLFLWFLVSFAPPILPYSAKVFPELPAALITVFVYRVIRYQKSLTVKMVFIIGLCLSILPWLQQRFIILSVLLAVYFVLLHWRQWHKCLWFLMPYLFSAMSLGLFYFVLYGDPLPSAPYTSIKMHSVWSLDILIRHGLWGLLFDQEFGLLIYAPVFLFIISGFWFKAQKDRLGSIFVFLLILSVYIPSAGFTLKWWGSWAPMGRYMVVLIPFLYELVAYVLARSLHSYLKWTLGLILWITMQFTIYLVQHYDLWIGAANGRSKLLSSLSVTVDLPQYFPSLVLADQHSYMILAVWIVFMIALNYGCVCSTQEEPSHPAPGSASQAREDSGFSRFLGEGSPDFPGHVFIRWSLLVLLTFFLLTTAGHFSQFFSHSYKSSSDFWLAAKRTLKDRGVIWSEMSHQGMDTPLLEYTYQTKRSAAGDGGSPSYLVSGPYITLPAGLYRAVYTIKLLDNSGHQVVAHLEVCTKRGHIKLASRTVHQSDFKNGETQQDFSLYFQLDQPTPNIETRVMAAHNVDFEIVTITVGTTEALRHKWRGRRLERLGFYAQALREYQAISIPESPYLTIVYHDKALLFAKLGRFNEAIENWQLYYTHHPHDRNAAQCLGELLIKFGDRDKGIELLRSLHSEPPP